jgi:hypothetical protein
MSKEPTGAKGRPNQARMGLGWSAQAGRPGPLFLEREDDATLSTCGHNHSQREREREREREKAICPRGRPQAREEGEE